MATENDWPGPVRVLVCMECGTEYTFDRDPVPADLACHKCGNDVFREFDDAERKGEEREEFDEETDRDLSTDAGAGDVSPTDLLDLNNP